MGIAQQATGSSAHKQNEVKHYSANPILGRWEGTVDETELCFPNSLDEGPLAIVEPNFVKSGFLETCPAHPGGPPQLKAVLRIHELLKSHSYPCK